MGVYTHSEGSWVSRRGGFIFLLVAFHVLLLWAFKSGFALKIIETIAPPIAVQKIDEVKPEEPPPPPPPVKAVELPPVSVPPVLVDIQVPVDTPPIQVTTAPPPPGPPAPPVYGPPAPPAPPAPVGTPYSVTYRPDVADVYPPTSLQLEETGRPVVRVCWDPKGKVTEVTVEEPSGKKRLDDAAIRFGKQMRFKAGTSDGQPVGGCVKQPVVFKLN